jgi:hypothetical protein
MDSGLLYLHMDSDYCWRWYITDAFGKSVAVTRSYFGLAEARQAMSSYAMPLAA